MYLTRYQEPKSLVSVFDDFFGDQFFNNYWEAPATRNFPVDIVENKDGYEFRAELPGLSKDDLKVQVENGVLTISGEKKSEVTEKKNGSHYRETKWGHFSRSFNLGDRVNPEKIEAAYKDGVLTLGLQKKEEAKPKPLQVQWK